MAEICYIYKSAPDWDERTYEIMKAVLPTTLEIAVARNNNLVVSASREAVDEAYNLAVMAVNKLKGGEK